MIKWISLQNPFVGTITATVILIGLFYYGVYNHISWLENSIPAFFSGVATILVGSYAFILYKRQKDDVKKDAASIILLELQNAEKVLKLLQGSLERDLPDLPSDAITMPTESWSKNKYLFVSDFDGNQWEAISNFYTTCGLLDEAVKTNASYFQKNEEQVRVNIQKRSADLAESFSKRIVSASSAEKKTKLREELRVKANEETALYLGAVFPYSPTKPITDAKISLEKLKLNISLPSAISRLKELSK